MEQLEFLYNFGEIVKCYSNFRKAVSYKIENILNS